MLMPAILGYLYVPEPPGHRGIRNSCGYTGQVHRDLLPRPLTVVNLAAVGKSRIKTVAHLFLKSRSKLDSDVTGLVITPSLVMSGALIQTIVRPGGRYSGEILAG